MPSKRRELPLRALLHLRHARGHDHGSQAQAHQGTPARGHTVTTPCTGDASASWNAKYRETDRTNAIAGLNMAPTSQR